MACVLIQQPNFWGLLEEVEEIASLAHENGALFIVCVNPISLGILEAPGNYGADIAVGEGQSLGGPVAFGGPFLGFFAARDKFIRQMPGRIAGATNDAQGRRGFVLTLQTREQHIRRKSYLQYMFQPGSQCSCRYSFSQLDRKRRATGGGQLVPAKSPLCLSKNCKH